MLWLMVFIVCRMFMRIGKKMISIVISSFGMELKLNYMMKSGVKVILGVICSVRM